MTEAEIAERYNSLSAHRREHCERVAEVMARLAERHGLDRRAAYWAAHGHDLAREMTRPGLLGEAERWGIAVDPTARQEPILLHGPVAAAWLESAGLGTPEVWDAIRYHTTGNVGLSPLGKALFVADGVEPGRRYGERAELAAYAETDLDGAYSRLLAHTAAYLRVRGLAPHPLLLAALQESAVPGH
ncbi:MAG: bis(5'-nucleosyl)-tetraphosphatase (symmetrical) YqeK [Thermaerobacter sp.]|nr:bis(5'-nucleosyl)-tetraphosphatase (symmetrical) YqeK [Thermaerobacter sp.]